MRTPCNSPSMRFLPLGRRRLEAAFDGGRITSDGGLLLLRELGQRSGFLGRLAGCFRDYRAPDRVKHPVESLLGQRLYALCLGYEDLNDHDRLRLDPLLQAAAGHLEDGVPLASPSTLNRLERAPVEGADGHRYRKITWKEEDLRAFFIQEAMRRYDSAPERIVLDVDATDDAIHGKQEGRFFHGYYRSYCYLPLYIFWDDFPVVAKLRTSDQDGAAGTLEEVQFLVAALREKWPEVEIWVRGDSGFVRDALMTWCEANKVQYVLGLAKNDRLKAEIEPAMVEVTALVEETGLPQRQFVDFRYKTLKSWSCERRVIGKAERLVGKRNPRFVVTTLPPERFDARTVYERLYAIRGDMENRIKEQQLDLFADRTSAATMRANQLRLWFSTLAYVLMAELRRVGLVGTELARAQAGTLRTRLLKVGGIVRWSHRRVHVGLSGAFPLQEVFLRALAQIRAAWPEPTGA